MTQKKNKKYNGFTLVELIAVIVIISLLAAGVAINFVGRIEEARIKTTKMNLDLLHQAVNQFKMDTGKYPSEEDGLYALIEMPTDVKNWQMGGYLETTDIPTDGWGNEFVYIRHPESGKPFVVKSYGADGEDGGKEDTPEQDLFSTDAD